MFLQTQQFGYAEEPDKNVPSTVIPVVGQVGKISKVSKIKTIRKGIKGLSKTKSDDLVEKLVTKGEDVGIVKKGEGFVEGVDNVGKELAEKGGELIGKYNWGTAKRYFQHIQEVTGRQVNQKQIDKIKDALKSKEYKRLPESEIAIHRANFNARKNKIIEDWEKETGQTWPTYTEPVYSANGIVLRKVGDKYDAHHIIENKFGGDNEWWNMHPAKFPDEHQGSIHGAGSPSRELFK